MHYKKNAKWYLCAALVIFGINYLLGNESSLHSGLYVFGILVAIHGLAWDSIGWRYVTFRREIMLQPKDRIEECPFPQLVFRRREWVPRVPQIGETYQRDLGGEEYFYCEVEAVLIEYSPEDWTSSVTVTAKSRNEIPVRTLSDILEFIEAQKRKGWDCINAPHPVGSREVA